METERGNTSWGRLPFAVVAGKIVRYLGGWLIFGLLAAICAAAFFGWLADEVFEGDTKNFDDNVRNYVHGLASPALTEAMKFFSFVGSPLFLVSLGIVAVAVFLSLKWKRALALFLITMAGELVLDLMLKGFFRRARPAAFFDYPLPSSFSFPSGHALGSFCFFGILAWLVAARLENKLLKTAIWIVAVFLIFAVGLSRVYLGVHFPSDVAASYATGLFWIAAVASGDVWLKRRAEK